MTKKSTSRDEILLRTGTYLDALADSSRIPGVRITGINIKINPGDALIVLKGTTAEGPVVGFVGAQTVTTAVRKAYAKARDEDIKWRPDAFTLEKLAEEEERW